MERHCNIEQCHSNFAGVPAAAVSARSDNDVSLSLFQRAMDPSRLLMQEPENGPVDATNNKKDAKEEEKTVEPMGEEGSLQVGRQSVPRDSLFGIAALKLNHTASNHSDNKSRGLQPVSQSQLSSRGSDFDANHTMAVVAVSSNGSWLNKYVGLRQMSVLLQSAVSSNGSWLNKYVGLRQLSVLLESRIMLPLSPVSPTVTPASEKNTSWLLYSAMFLIVVLVCVWCFGGDRIGSSSSSMSTHSRGGWPPSEAHLGYARKARVSHGSFASQSFNPMTPRAAPGLSVATLPTSTSMLLPQSSMIEADSILCTELVVPPNKECILQVPINPKGSFHVTDTEGNNILFVELKVSMHERCRIKLSSCEGFGILGQCVAIPVHGSVHNIQLLRASGECFAKLVQIGPHELASPGHVATWTIRTRAGIEWFFRGQFDSYAVNVTDNFGRWVAMSQQHEHETCLLSVSPLVDVSIVLLCLFAVKYLT